MVLTSVLRLALPISSKEMTTIIEDGGRTNIYAVEPEMYTTEITMPHNEFAENLNGRLPMLGVIPALGSYAVTGPLIPGIR